MVEITVAEHERIYESLMSVPLTARGKQRPLNIGLFDEDTCNQASLF